MSTSSSSSSLPPLPTTVISEVENTNSNSTKMKTINRNNSTDMDLQQSTVASASSSSSSYYPPRVVHFAESYDQQDSKDHDENCNLGNDEFSFHRTKSFGEKSTTESDPELQKRHSSCSNQQQSGYSSIYLSPQELPFQLSRSSPTSPAGSNVSIVGSLISPGSNECKSNGSGGNNNGGSSSTNWKLRARYYSKRRGQERSIDRERQPSICSDSETDSMSCQHKIEDILKSYGNTTKKWSLPLPVVIRSSESDSASSSWSARSADEEATEDERSPVPSPSASMNSNDEYLPGIPSESGNLKSPTSLKTIEMESKKLAIKAVKEETDEFVNHKYGSNFRSGLGSSAASIVTTPTPIVQDAGQSSRSSSKKDKGKGRKKKKMSRAAESHHFQRMKTTNYGRCIICDAYVYFWGFECTQCQLICHKKCLKNMAIMCPRAPLPPRSSILNLQLDALPQDEMVPLLIQKCTMEIERRAIQRPGLYRMTGVASRLEKLLKSFESGPHLIDLTNISANDLTSVLKIFLRELKDPLITNDVYKDFIDIGRIYRHDQELCQDGITLSGHSQFIRKLHKAIGKLTPHHRATLKHMIEHLNRVAGCQEQNCMSPAALGIIFAPTIFRPRDTINDLYTEVFEAAPQARVIELLIRFYGQIFEMDTDFIDEPIVPSLLQQNVNEQQQPATTSTMACFEMTTADITATTNMTTNSLTNQLNSESGTTGSISNNNINNSSQTWAPSSTNIISTSVSLSPPLTPPLPSQQQQSTISNQTNNPDPYCPSLYENSIHHRSETSLPNMASSFSGSLSASSLSGPLTNHHNYLSPPSQRQQTQTRTRHCFNCSRPTTFTFD